MERMATGLLVLIASLVTTGMAHAQDRLDCVIEPWRKAMVSAAIEGVVEEVLVDRGDRVVKGQIVARLESSVEVASLEVARARASNTAQLDSGEARLRFAERELIRHEQLEVKDVVSASRMDEAEVAKQIAESAYQEVIEAIALAGLDRDRVQATLERRVIRSPIDGVVVRRILGSGEYADPPQIMEIAQIDPLRVEVFAPLVYLGRVEPGDSVIVRPEEPVGGRYEAQVDVVDRVVDAASGTFGIRIKLANPELTLPAGLRCTVDLTAPSSVAAIPVAIEASAETGITEPGH